MNNALLAVVRIRGIRNMDPNIKQTLEFLNLKTPNHCVLVQATPQTQGMLAIVKDYVAFGLINEETVLRLLLKRGEKGSKSLTDVMKEAEIKSAAKEIVGGKKVRDFGNPIFRLHPPRKGYKNLKRAYPLGDLGKRDDMDMLLKKMM